MGLEIENTEPTIAEMDNRTKLQKSLKTVDMLLIHMSRFVTDVDEQRRSRDAIRMHLTNIRKLSGFTAVTKARLPEGVCPMCDRRFETRGRIKKDTVSFLDQRRNMNCCPYCNTIQNRTKSAGDICETKDCTAVVMLYFNRATWFVKPRH